MSKLSNEIRMIMLLSTGKKYSIKELSKELEVTERMIRIYKDDLEKSGIYVDSLRGPYGGYVLNERKSIVNIGLSKYDIQILKNIKNMFNSIINFELKKEYFDCINKIVDAYEFNSQNKKQFDKNEVYRYKLEEQKKYNDFNKSINQKKKVFIEYISVDSNISKRKIHPCDMFRYDNYWYVSAFCELRREIRHFRLERIIKYNILTEGY